MLELLEDRRVPSTIPNDPRLAELWGLDKIGAPAAWDLTTGSTRVVVAVNDSGVDYTHPDLYKNIWINQAEIPSTIRPRLQDVDHDGLITFWDLNDASGINIGPGKITDLNGTGFIDGGDLLYPVASGGWANGSDDGPNGYPDDLIGWDFFGGDNDPMDEVGHGTKVAGIIGATANNGAGIAGVNWQVEIMPLVRTPRSSVEALLYAVNNGARISNHSYGILASEVTLAERATITAVGRYAAAKGHLAVAAANNQASDIDAVPIFPASLDLPNIIAVAATTRDDKLAEFSNYGAASVDLGAPGVDIWSTIPGGGYDEGNGTSFAAPHVAGAAALILARNPGLSYAQVKALILDNVDPLPALQGKTVTGGRLNIFKALSAAEPPARVESVIVNDGAAQRSMVNSLTVTLDHVVTLAPGAFELRRQDGSLVGLNVTASTVGGRTVAVLTFAGSDILGGSLADGSYALTIRGDRIHDAIGRPLDGDGDGLAGGDRADRFFRLFGDSDGDGDVGRLDRDRFRSAFKTSAGEAGYLWYFDFDGDGDVDGRDNGQFNRRFGQH